MITTSGLTKIYRANRSRGREVVALDGIDLHVREGEVYGVIGRSGAGKSSLIRCVNLLERPTSGTVTVAGQDLTALAGRGPRGGRELRQARSRIGMVFQHFNLLSSRTAQDNVEVPLEILGKSGKERSRKALELLDLVGLADKAGAYPAQLSGGQKLGVPQALEALGERRHRPRPGRRPQGAAVRRGHQRPRPGDHPLDPDPAARPQPPARPHRPAHHPRDGRREVDLRLVALIGYSAMAGTVGAGGLGDIAIRYGYQRFETQLMWITVAILAVVISLIQFAGDLAARSLHSRGGRSGPAPRLRLLKAEGPAPSGVGKVA